MIFEAIAEAVFPVLGRILGYIFLDLIGQIICYSIGFVTVKIFTLGRHPKTFFPPGSDSGQEIYVILVGIAVSILIFISGMVYFNV